MSDDSIDRLTPAQRMEVQEYFLLRDRKRRDFRDSGRQDRRHLRPRRRPWPHPSRLLEMPSAMRDPYTSSYRNRVLHPGSRNMGNTNWRGRPPVT